jgi:hypothetical protein
VIHTHAEAAVLATLLFPGPEFRITHQEMIKVCLVVVGVGWVVSWVGGWVFGGLGFG